MRKKNILAKRGKKVAKRQDNPLIETIKERPIPFIVGTIAGLGLATYAVLYFWFEYKYEEAGKALALKVDAWKSLLKAYERDNRSGPSSPEEKATYERISAEQTAASEEWRKWQGRYYLLRFWAPKPQL